MTRCAQVTAQTAKAESQAAELRLARQQLVASRQGLDGAIARAAVFEQQVSCERPC